jgi:hypothetical protein
MGTISRARQWSLAMPCPYPTHWEHPATREESDTIGTFYVRWGGTPGLWEIETDDGFSLEDLLGLAAAMLPKPTVRLPSRERLSR